MNDTTEETSWERPAPPAVKKPPPKKPAPPKNPLPPGWREEKTDEGEVYCTYAAGAKTRFPGINKPNLLSASLLLFPPRADVNDTTEETSWERPSFVEV